MPALRNLKHNLASSLCMVCLHEWLAPPAPRIALRQRLHHRGRFGAQATVRWLEHATAHIPEYYLLKDPKDLIIKVGEFCQREIARPEIQRAFAGAPARSNPPILSQEPKVRKARQEKTGLLDRLFQTVGGGACFYCRQEVPPEQRVADCPLPVWFNHSSNGSHTLGFLRALEAAGLLVPACQRCNSLKSIGEIGGCKIWQSMHDGNWRVEPCLNPQAPSPLLWNPKLTFPIPPKVGGNRPLRPDGLALLARYLQVFALRLTAPCQHKNDIWFVRFIPELRTIQFGCRECLGSAPVHLKLTWQGQMATPSPAARSLPAPAQGKNGEGCH